MTGLALEYHMSGGYIPYSVLLQALLTMLPAALHPNKIQVTHDVPKYIMPADVDLIPDAGFYFSYFSSFVLDFGYAGIGIALLMYGYFLSASVMSVRNCGIFGIGFSFLLPIHFLLNGELSFYFTHVFFGAISNFLLRLR